MAAFRQRVLERQTVWGVWNGMASSISAEITGKIGFDWVLIDQEHSPGDTLTLMHQLMALNGSSCAPLVRIPWNDRVFFKKALDLGAAGIMVPTVDSAEEARRAVAFMRYPLEGSRGVAGACRAAGYTLEFRDYLSRANTEITAIMQIETAAGVAAADEIAAVDGVDVLFVGPVDLSFALNTRTQFENPEFVKALGKVADAGKRHGKGVGILVPNLTNVPMLREMGFTFIAVGSDMAAIVSTLSNTLASLRAL